MIRLKELLFGLDYRAQGDVGRTKINKVVSDSREVGRDDLFVAICGTERDGHEHIPQALKRGARAVMQQKDVDTGDSLNLKVKETRKALALAAGNFYKNPSRDIKVIGVTGTNGKTTVTYLLEGILKAAGFSVGVIGTVRYKVGGEIIEADNTTPSPLILQGLLRKMVDGSLDYCVAEVSSHALDQRRTDGIDFNAAIFTNATEEHLDYHKNFRNYLDAKVGLFRGLGNDSLAIINRDDPSFYKVRKASSSKRTMSFGLGRDSDLYADNVKLSINGSAFVIRSKEKAISVKSRLIGMHNVYNMLAASSFAVAEGIDPGAIKDGLEGIKGVPGRLQCRESGGVKVFVDYAHTDDALEKVLTALSGLKTNRIVTVFGCGGDRDKKKRPRMGAVAARFSDYVVITSDNPRREEPGKIIKDITKGISPGTKNFAVVEDRREAIREAFSYAQDGDIVLIAGKGHERYQIIKDKKIPFDDMEVVREFTKTEASLRALSEAKGEAI